MVFYNFYCVNSLKQNNIMQDNTFTLHQNEIPKVVGSYEITGSKVSRIEFNFTKKPNLINRLFCKWCLGWTWRDI